MSLINLVNVKSLLRSLNTLSKLQKIPASPDTDSLGSSINESGSISSDIEIKLSEKATEETLVFISRDQFVSSGEWNDVTFSAGENSTFMSGLAQYIDNQGQSIEQKDFDGINETFEGFNDGEFTSTWSGYLYVPESGHYNFIAEIIGGFALTINGEEYLTSQITQKGNIMSMI